MIKFSKVNLKYTKEYYALCNINLTLNGGEKICVIGEKESGKTSLLRVLAGLEQNYTGDVTINGSEIKELNYKTDISVGYLPMRAVFEENKTLYNNMLFALKLRNSEISDYDAEQLIDNKLNAFGLMDYKNVKVKKLNYYQKLVSAIARLSMRKLDLLLVDNLWNELTEEELKTIKTYLVENFKNDDCTWILSCNRSEKLEDLNLTKYFMHAGILENMN